MAVDVGSGGERFGEEPDTMDHAAADEVGDCVVLRRPLVPDDDIAVLPPVAVHEVGPDPDREDGAGARVVGEGLVGVPAVGLVATVAVEHADRVAVGMAGVLWLRYFGLAEERAVGDVVLLGRIRAGEHPYLSLIHI